MNGFNQYMPKLLQIWHRREMIILCRQQINQNNIPSKAVEHYLQRPVKSPFVDIAFIDNETSFESRKEITSLTLQELDENTVIKLNQFLTDKCDFVTPLPIHFHDELIRWRSLCIRKLWFSIDNIHFKSACWGGICLKHSNTSEDTVRLSCWKREKQKGLFPLYVGYTIGSVIVSWQIY